jgi:hypothetical protein
MWVPLDIDFISTGGPKGWLIGSLVFFEACWIISCSTQVDYPESTANNAETFITVLWSSLIVPVSECNPPASSSIEKKISNPLMIPNSP